MNADDPDDTDDDSTGMAEFDDESPDKEPTNLDDVTDPAEESTDPDDDIDPPSTEPPPRPGEPGVQSLADNQTLVMGAGVLIGVCGVLAILSPFITGITVTLVFGALLVVGAIVHTASAFSARGWSGFTFGGSLAILYGFAGIVLLANPTLGLVTLTLFLGVYFLVEGVIQLLLGLRIRANPNWSYMLFSGIVSLLLSSLVLLEFPSSAEWAVGLLFGVNLLTTGVALTALAMAASPDRPATTTAGPVEESGT